MEPDSNQFKVMKALALSSTIGTSFAICVYLGYYIGNYFDNKFGTEPWLLLVGIFLGLGIGIWGTIQLITSFWKEK